MILRYDLPKTESKWQRLLKLEVTDKLYDPITGIGKYFVEQKPENIKVTSVVQFDKLVEVIEFPSAKHAYASKINELSSIALNMKKK